METLVRAPTRFMASARSTDGFRDPGSGERDHHAPAEGSQNLTIPEESMTTEVDPIFTAIAAYTAAVEHHGAMLDAEESLEVTEEVTDLAVDQESQALRAMLTTTP